jgi:cytochrome c553
MRTRPGLVLPVLAALLLVVAACGDGGDRPSPPAASPSPAAEPVGAPLSSADIAALAAQFADNPLTGGQHAPRSYRWVNDQVAIFLQFDNADPAKATALRYIGVSVKGVFCAEDQPGGPNGGFPHFHRLDAPEYAQGHGGPAGTPGYWLSWVAVDSFSQRDGRQVKPGVDYQFSPTPAPPACAPNVPKADFTAPGAKKLSHDDLATLATLFTDQPLTGGQTAPRRYRWVTKDNAIFLQFDNPDLAKATALRYVGISVRGEFCKSKQPSADFPHFHRTSAAEYAKGHGQAPGDRGYWLLWMATDTFAQRDGRQVKPGVDRQFSPTPPPEC